MCCAENGNHGFTLKFVVVVDVAFVGAKLKMIFVRTEKTTPVIITKIEKRMVEPVDETTNNNKQQLSQ
jgi:hypothetical protein